MNCATIAIIIQAKLMPINDLHMKWVTTRPQHEFNIIYKQEILNRYQTTIDAPEPVKKNKWWRK